MEMMMMFSEDTQLMSLPDDVIMECIAPRVSRCNYPILSFVSKPLRSLVWSSEIYMKRSLLGCTEPCVYVLIYDHEIGISYWYSLIRGINRNMVGNRLVRILSLPPMPRLAEYAVVGSKIFVMGGVYGMHDSEAPTMLCIDCHTHTVRRVADMPILAKDISFKVINEKIYIIGKRVGDPWYAKSKIVMMFDLQTETWEHKTIENDFQVLDDPCVKEIMDYKMWSDDENVMDIKNYQLWEDQCVMNELLYEYNSENLLRAFDQKQRTWTEVKGMRKFPVGGPGDAFHLISCNEKLILFMTIDNEFDEQYKIWCAEITVEKHQEGEIWGNVESCDLILNGHFAVDQCLVVTL